MSRGHLTHGLQEQTPAPERDASRVARPSFRPAWFAGCNLRILARTPSEGTFYDALGLAVLLLSCLGGFAAYFSIAYVLDAQTAAVAVGIVWAVILSCGVERLLLQVAGSREHLGALAVAVVPRVFISILIGFILAEPLILRINEPEINAYLQESQRAEKRALFTEAGKTYEETIDTKEEELSTVKAQEKKVETQRDGFLRRQSECEAEAPASACRVYAQAAAREAGWLQEVRADNAERRPRLEESLARWRERRGTDEGRGQDAITESDGVLARIEALGSLGAEHPVMNIQAWILRLFFICLDLLPLTIKVTRILSIDSPYEIRAAAARQRDALGAEAEDLVTEVERQRLKDQARADKRVNQAAISADADQRIYAATGEEPYGFTGADVPVSAMSLDEFVDNVEIYERRPVDVPDELRRSGLIGLGLIGAAAAIAVLASFAGAWLLIVALVLGIVLGAYTRGFREAPAWAMRPILATLIVGLVLPPIVMAINVV